MGTKAVNYGGLYQRRLWRGLYPVDMAGDVWVRLDCSLERPQLLALSQPIRLFRKGVKSMQKFRVAVFCSIAAFTVAACADGNPTGVISAHDVARVEDGGGFGSGTRSDSSATQNTAPASDDEGGELKFDGGNNAGGGFGSGT